ncbi:MAG: hypothetical protein BMS9Abin31_0392 [Gammaproteobacteria bacterium]|nr:MAG: hypothetical protein BMS9Abin31_0392 [Gammaproteobacteria bacterium]
MTHVLFYIGLSVMLFFSVYFIFLIKLRKEKKLEIDVFKIR